MKRVTWFITALLLPACPPSGTMEPEPVVVVQPGGEFCAEACDRMAVAGPDESPCEESTPVTMRDGSVMSCTEFCVYQHDNGVYWNTKCMMAISTCEEIETKCNVPPPD